MSTSLRHWMPWVYFFSFVPLGAIFPYLVEELRGRHVDNIGLLLALPALMSLLIGPVWGLLADWCRNWGRILTLASFLAFIGVCLLGWMDPGWAFLAMLLYAVGRAPITPISDALALEAISDEPEAYGSIRVWGSVGYMVGVLVVGCMQYFFPVSAFWVGATGAFLFTVLSIFLPSPQRVKNQALSKALKILVTNSDLLWLLLCSALHFSVHIANSSFLVIHVSSMGLNGLWVGVSISAGIVVEIFVMSRASDLQQRWNAKQLFQIAAVLAFFRWICMALATTGWMIFLCQATHGITFGLFWLAAIQLVSQHTPSDAAATGQTLLSAAVGGVGAAIGVYTANWIVESSDTVVLYWTSACVAVVVTIMTKWLK
jgi:MFS transporter, PPP family, 3-phenylpropionic acid transporter